MRLVAGPLALVGDRNRPGRKDWSGAFRPEARRFATGGTLLQIPLDAPKAQQRAMMLAAIRQFPPTALGIFCHGLSRKIELGFDTATVDELAAALAEVGCDRVALYCCSTGSGPGVGGDRGFADALRDAMCRAGLTQCRVIAHTTAGHATQNPHKRVFEGMGSPVGGVGGYAIVERGSALWRPWVRALREPENPLRFDLATLSVADVHRRLSSDDSRAA